MLNEPLPLSDECGLREALLESFAVKPYTGQVTTADGMEWAEELDDDLGLWHELSGKAWTSIPDEFLDRHANSLVLLTPEAFAAFIPAWIRRALSDDDVREFTIYAIEPPKSGPCFAALMQHWRARLGRLTIDQLRTVRTFLSCVRDHDPDRWNREHAMRALEALPLG